MNFMLASEAATCCEGKLYGPNVKIIRTWKCDSREVCLNDAFVAIKGATVDGHMYIEDAIKNGAKLMLVDSSEMKKIDITNPVFFDITFIATDDTVQGLAKIAQSYLKRISPKVIGITGSVGKTTTRELVVSVLKERYRVHGAIRSFNTVIGCSLTVLAMPLDTEILVLEFGANHFGEITEMVNLFLPETVIITAIAPAHLEGFGSVEGVLRAKLEICSSKSIKNIIYNADNLRLNESLLNDYKNCNKISIGYENNASLKIIKAKILLDGLGPTLCVEYLYDNNSFIFEVPLFGIQQAYNVGYAFATGILFNICKEKIEKALESSQSIDGRGILSKIRGNTWVVDEAYNANPSSMKAAIDNVINMGKNYNYKLYAVLGGMRELGEASVDCHKEIISKLICFEKVVLLGEEWYHLGLTIPENIRSYKSFNEMSSDLELSEISNGIILIKGSNSYGLKKIVSQLMEVSALD